MIMSTKKKHILIIGASSGIGMAIADLCSDLYNMSLTGRNTKSLHKYHETENLQLDVLSNDDIVALANDCNPIDGLVYCPGIAPVIPAHHVKEKSLNEVMRINFEAAALITASLLKAKKINKGASLLYISSQAVRHPFFGSSAYSSSKAALEAYAISLSKELQNKKIRANCIAPAYVESQMLEDARKNLSTEFVDNMKKMHPDAFSDADKIASIAAFLLSDNASSINGQIIEAGTFNINIPAL